LVILDVYLACAVFCNCAAGGPAYQNLFNTKEYDSMQHVTDEFNDTVHEDMQYVLKIMIPKIIISKINIIGNFGCTCCHGTT